MNEREGKWNLYYTTLVNGWLMAALGSKHSTYCNDINFSMYKSV